MGTFKDSLKKWFFNHGSAAATPTCRIPLLDHNGNPIGSDTPTRIIQRQTMFTGNVGVAYYEDGFVQLLQPEKAVLDDSVPNGAFGVWILEHGKLLIVSLDEGDGEWSTTPAGGGTDVVQNFELAIGECNNGKSNTNTIYQTLGNNALAAKASLNYCPSSVQSDDSRVGVGKWWLPCLGELGMIYSHLNEINNLISILGGTPFLEMSNTYWSSTEGGTTTAWYFDFASGIFNGDESKDSSMSYRFVTSLIGSM